MTNRHKQILKELREHWFKNHKAELIQYPDISILKWKNPNSNSYYIKYIFDGCRMYITGDAGDAVFNLTWKATLESFANLDVDYFLSKMTTCSNGKETYSSQKLVERLKKWRSELLETTTFTDEQEREVFLKMFHNLILGAESCTSTEQWAWEYVNSTEFNDFIESNDCDYWEWIYNIGMITPYHNFAYLLGLTMAYEQLNKNNTP